MPQQLIYTSAPRGLVAGRSGHCTVARSASMREALMLQLEKLCYYQHLSLSGGKERPIYAYRIVDIRGTRFHVLSRIQDAGLDFTGRTNFIAHHLVLAPEELRQSPTPPVILRDWPGWVKSWTKEPQLLESEDWSSFTALVSRTCVPAQTWQRVTGDAVNGYGLLETRAGASFRVDDQAEETVLELLAESMELLEVRDTRRDFRSASWPYTFTTSMQEQDNPADFRWRCIHSDNPAASRFAGPDCRALSSVRASRCSPEETTFARSGRQPPRFVVEPQDARIVEGETARFQVKAEGVPHPSYQWFTVDKAGNGQIIAGENGLELAVPNPPLGLSRYVVRASNSAGEATTDVVTLSVEQKLRLAHARLDSALGEPAKVGASYMKSEDDIEKQRKRLQAEQAQEQFQKRLRRNKVFSAVLVVVLIGGISAVCWKMWTARKSKSPFLAWNERKSENTNNPPAAQPPNNPATGPTSQNPSKTPSNPSQSDESKPSTVDSQSKAEHPVNPPPPTEFSLPEGWARMVVGNVLNPNAEFVSPRFDLSGAAEGFLTSGDSVLFACATNMATDFQATLLKSESVSPASRCGIMMRESEKPNASFLFIGASPEKVFVYSRDDAGKFTSSEYEIPKSNQNKQLYLRFQRKGPQQIVPSYSFNSKDWIPNETNTISINGNMFVGLAICSGSSSNKVVAKFGGVSPSGATNPKK